MNSQVVTPPELPYYVDPLKLKPKFGIGHIFGKLFEIFSDEHQWKYHIYNELPWNNGYCPPYNIHVLKVGDKTLHTIQLAASGMSADDFQVLHYEKECKLAIIGNVKRIGSGEEFLGEANNYSHKGISDRPYAMVIYVGPECEIFEPTLADGLFQITISEPEAKPSGGGCRQLQVN